MIQRRIFLKDGALAVMGLSMVPGFVQRMALSAQTRFGAKKTLITVFQRGGVDGLNMVVPFGEKSYYDYRPTIAVPAPSKERDSALDLDGFFGLHPALQPLLPIYQAGDLAIIQAVGSPDETRSHFQAQSYMESAAPGDPRVRDGWLNRYLHENQHPEATSFRGIAMDEVVPRSLKGDAPVLALGDLTGSQKVASARSLYESMYDRETNALLSGTSKEMFNAIDQLSELNPVGYQPANGAQYPNNGGDFGRAMRQLAQLLKADLGVEIAFVDIGGWDTHQNEGSLEGRLPQRLGVFGRTLSAFYTDMGDRMEDIIVLTMSEFGRTARENGNAGTDHGKANVMFVMGGAVKGGAVYCDWPGLAPEQLNEDRDLAMTTDFRDVFAEVLIGHMGAEHAEVVFPGYDLDPALAKGLLLP